jgi:hypothetical protein
MEKVNLYNPEVAIKYAAQIAASGPDHVLAWFTSTFARWLQAQDQYKVQCVSAKTARSPQYRMLKAFNAVLPDSKRVTCHEFGAETLPDWATNALADHRLWMWIKPSTEDRTQFVHWYDYACTLPARDIRMTVDQMLTAVYAWDKQLARQKLLSDMREGTELVWQSSPGIQESVDGVTNGQTQYQVVKLITAAAYKAEGAVMKHCVAGYHGRASTTIYSLRVNEQENPLATVEVAHGTGAKRGVAQVQGPCNQKITDAHTSVLREWARAKRISWFPAWVQEMEDEEDDDEYEDDEDEDDSDDEDASEDDGSWE